MILVVEVAAEKQQLPEAPISIAVMAYYAGFQVLITRRAGEQPIISQVSGIVTLVKKLVESVFGHINHNMRFSRFSYKGLDKVKTVGVCNYYL